MLNQVTSSTQEAGQTHLNFVTVLLDSGMSYSRMKMHRSITTILSHQLKSQNRPGGDDAAICEKCSINAGTLHREVSFGAPLPKMTLKCHEVELY